MFRLSELFLSLLLCSLSGAELQDNEIIDQREVRLESVNVPEPQPCPSDLHAVLRDMSVKLAVLQVRMETQTQLQVKVEQLQMLNQEQAAKLKELQTQVDTQTQAQTNEVDALRKQQQAQASELKSIKTRTNETEKQVESLRRERAVGRVAFSASLLASGRGNTGPFNTDTPLVFRHVVSNIGNAYSPNTGFFTAPLRGAYHFEFYIGAEGHSVHPCGAWLVKNGEQIFMAYHVQPNGFGTSANGATLLLEAGDTVFLRQYHNSIIHDSLNRHSTFSGRLLFPL